MTNEYYTRAILYQKNTSYQAQLENKFKDKMEEINKCIDACKWEKDLHNCLKEEIKDKEAEEVMRILGFITLGG